MCKWDAAESMRVGEYIKVAYIDAEKACRIVELKILLYNKNKWSNEEKKKRRKTEETKMGSVWAETGIGRLRRTRERERERERKKGSRDEERGENEREKIN